MMDMKTLASVIAGSLIASTLAFAGTAAAVTPDPVGPHYSIDNHDDINTSNGFVDRPF